MGCPKREVAPCRGVALDVIFGDDPDVIFGDDDVDFGDIFSECIAPPVVVECTEELPCDEDIPLVQFFQAPASGNSQVVFQWYGIDSARYKIEYLISGKLVETTADGVTKLKVFHDIDDIGQVPDVDSPGNGQALVGVSLIAGRIYSVSLRRVDITTNEVGVWVQGVFIASDDPFPIFVVDGSDMIMDDVQLPATIADVIVQVPIIDGYP